MISDFVYNHPIIGFALIAIFTFCLIAFFMNIDTGFGSYWYEYETVDGEKGYADFCSTTNHVPKCWSGGETILGLKRYERVAK